MAKKATGTGKVKISYKKLHKELTALSKRIKEVRKIRPHVTKLKKVESKILALQSATQCQKVMVLEL
jgi:hypothetical protein